MFSTLKIFGTVLVMGRMAAGAYERTENVSCGNRKVKIEKSGVMKTFKTLNFDKAKAQCDALGEECIGVQDPGCNGEGKYTLCKKSDKLFKRKRGHCVYMKEDVHPNFIDTFNFMSGTLSEASCETQQDTDYSGDALCQWATCPRTSNAGDCCTKCQEKSGCGAAVYYDGVCYLKASASGAYTNSGRVGVIPGGGPSPSPGPSPTPSGDILGSFMVLGDWGYDTSIHGNVRSSCQGDIGRAMQDYMNDHPGEVRFVLNLGDSFYPSGIPSVNDWRWQSMWVNKYGEELTNLPWFSVYGNHDYEGKDKCACTTDYSGCVQMQATNQKRGWYMPNTTFYDTRYESELGVEILALDTNWLDHGSSCGWQKHCSVSTCEDILRDRMTDAMNLFNERIERSTAKNLLIINHYPTDYFHDGANGVPSDFMEKLKDNSRRHIEFYGGHRHNVDQTSITNISPNNAWLVGGGGGWGCDGGQQGFVVGQIHKDFSITTKSVLVDNCCTRRRVEGVSFQTPPSAACSANLGCLAQGKDIGDCCPNRQGEYHECCSKTAEFGRHMNITFTRD